MSLDLKPTAENLHSDMVVVDIRTEPEWKETGIVEGAHCVTFFDQFGQYNAEAFFKKMDELGGKEVEIGLICRTGSRTHQVAVFMKQHGYNVKNLTGGVMQLMQEGYDLVPYK